MKINKLAIWAKYMEIGKRSGCHQLAERSFFCGTYQFPICARCTGVFMGYILSTCTFFIYKSIELAIVGCLLMFFDWYIQYKNWIISTNFRRLVTGICGGYGILSIQLLIVSRCVCSLQKIF